MATQAQADAGRLTEFQQNVLAALGELEQSGNHKHDVPHGLAIKERLETAAYYGQGVKHGRLYPNLDTLVENGLVEKESVDRRTNGFSLTENGKQYLVATGERLLAAVPESEA